MHARALAVVLVVAGFAACGAQERPAPPAPVAATPAPSASEARLAVLDGGDRGCATPTSYESGLQAEAQPTAEPDMGWASGEMHVKSSKDACGVADDNLEAAENAILAQAAPSGPPAASPAWDHKTPPLYLDRIDRRYRLTADEKRLLSSRGFVVSSRIEPRAYGWHLHEIFQSELPLYVSADSLFHAAYIGNDDVIRHVESEVLDSLLEHVLTKLACALPAAAEGYTRDAARDLDVYLAVATALLHGFANPTVFGQDDDRVADLVKTAEQARGMGEVPLFGRPRMIDWSQYEPRGHYAAGPSGDLSHYFRASMWLSRLELNLVSRSSRSSEPGAIPNPEETPREAVDALALADLVDRAGVGKQVDMLDRAWAALAGRREDVSIAQLQALRRKAGIASLRDADVFPRLKAAIGDDFQRTARLHWMPQRSPVLPAIATLLGPRVVPDTVATRPLVHDEIPGRYLLHPLDMAYALGDDRAKEYLTADRRRFPTLDRQLGVARGIVQAPLPEGDLYSAWFGAVRALASEPAVPTGATAPSFMTTPAFADARLGSVIAAFGQVRHNYVLLSGQGYDAYGCEIPDGWVEPAPDAYDALARYADRGAATFRAFDPSDRSHAAAYFARLGRLMRVFRAIAASELAGRPLSTDERRFLAMVVEHVPLQANCDSCPPPTYTGWWFDLFLARVKDGLSPGAFMADFYTSTNEQRIAYVGATAARLGVFVVDTGGPPRAFVGPVSHAFEYTGPTDRRLTDADAERASRDGQAPWAASYTAAAPAEPPLQLIVCSEGVGSPWCLEQLPAAAKRHVKTGDKTPAIVAVSTRALGNVTVELLDHHRVPVARDTRAVDANGAAFHFPGALGVHAAPSPPAVIARPEPPRWEGVAVRVGDFQYVWASPPFDWVASYTLGAMRPPDPPPQADADPPSE